jgi:hypothetical protein
MKTTLTELKSEKSDQIAKSTKFPNLKIRRKKATELILRQAQDDEC